VTLIARKKLHKNISELQNPHLSYSAGAGPIGSTDEKSKAHMAKSLEQENLRKYEKEHLSSYA
jgi:hypothetical protein